ncbi:hypothetical protein MCEMIH15_00176 [Caulobacteraceae bacterium]
MRQSRDWTLVNPLAGGAYIQWAADQIGRWAGKMGAPAAASQACQDVVARLQSAWRGCYRFGFVRA